MPVTPEDRPLDALREDTIDQLVMNYGHGHLSLEAFQRRLDQAYDAGDHAGLAVLTADLQTEVDAGYVALKREQLGFSPDPAEPAREVDYLVNVLGGSERSGEWTAAGQIRVVDVLGGAKLDFSAARFSTATVRVRVVCLLGGVEILVPEGVAVTLRAANILGGVHNRASARQDPGAPRIVIDGLVLLGGLHVKVKRSVRERVLQFADSVRQTFGRSPQAR